MKKNRQKRTTRGSTDQTTRAMLDLSTRRLRRVEAEANELKVRLECLARAARFKTPESIKGYEDLWVVSIEAMAERARYVADVALGTRP